MKLSRLLLQAFGPFTDAEIDFSGGGEQPAPNLHLIYGPNEAGKSSALRAMTDLRFGIPQRSPDNFIHPYNRLRIAGIFIAESGEAVGLARHKGRGATLSRFETVTGEPIAAPEAASEYERALTGGLNREEFETMFGLNHARLRAGGERLLKGEGELGSALFEASAGTRGISAILAELERDAKALFNPHGRAQSAVINEARRELDAQRDAWRRAQTRPADWQALNRAHGQAKEELSEVDRALETLRRRENELTELRTVEPLLREQDRLIAELARLEGVPELPENSRERRLAAEHALRRAEQDQQQAERELARCAESLAALNIEAPLLVHEAAIERLANGVETAARSRIEARRQQSASEGIEAEMKATAVRIAATEDIEAMLAALPSAADRVALDDRLGTIGRLRERLDGYRSREEELASASDTAGAEIQPAVSPEARDRLNAVLGDARRLGDISRRTSELARDAAEVEGALAQSLSDLGIESVPAMRHTRPLLDAQIAQARKALTDIDDATSRLTNEDRLVEGDLDKQRLRHRQLAAQGEVVTAQTLLLARERRDRGWTLIRRAYVERSQPAGDLAPAFDPERPLPEAFESAQADADRQADLLRADASRATGLAECAARIEEMEKRRRDIAEGLARLSERRMQIQTDWSRRMAQSGLPDLEPETLREWQAEREAALNLASRLDRLQADGDRLVAEANTAAATLAHALQAVGQPAKAKGRLAALINQAARWEQHAAAAQAKRSARAEGERRRRAEREKVDAQIAKTAADLARLEEDLRAWHARLFLPRDSTPASVKARLGELDGLVRQSAALAEARRRQAEQRAAADDFGVQASHLAKLLGEPVAELADDFADRLRERLNTSREQDRQRRTLLSDQDRAYGAEREARATQAEQSAILAQLCAAAGVETVEQLPAREELATRKSLVRHALDSQRQQLTQASTRSEEALRERLANQDAVAIDAERSRCREDITRLEENQASARQAEEQARRALEAIDASDRAATAREAMESAAARYRSAIRPWARLKLSRALLEEALNRFRDRAQAPMIAAASTYFSLISGGRYPRLIADEEGGKPTLRVERVDGTRIGVDEMSDGTADQLYLALRLAALELRRVSHPRMPLILDDVLITSDDRRVVNILRALAKFAEGGQVMLFTHHRHLIDLARGVLGTRDLAVHEI